MMLKKQLKCKLAGQKEVYELRALGHVTCMYSHLFLPCLQFLLPFRVVAFHGESVELFYLVHLEILWKYHLRTFRSAFTTTTAIFSFVVVPS